MSLFSIHAVLRYSNTDIVKARKKSCFISLNRSDFHVIDNLFIAVKASTWCMLTSLSVDEMLLSRYVNWFTNIRGLPLRVEIAPPCTKLMKSVLLAFTWRLIPPAACSRQCRRDLAWAGVFARNAKLLFCFCHSFRMISYRGQTLFFGHFEKSTSRWSLVPKTFEIVST